MVNQLFKAHSRIVVGLVAACWITACSTVDERLISHFGTSAEEMASAKQAVEICGATAFEWGVREQLFLNAGYDRPNDYELKSVANELDAVLLVKPGTGIIVQLGGEAVLGGKSQSGCIVGLKGMSPQQSYDLALPLADAFDAPTNAEIGKGLARNSIEVWNLYGDDHTVRIAAKKTWHVLGEPGAAVRLVTAGQRP